MHETGLLKSKTSLLIINDNETNTISDVSDGDEIMWLQNAVDIDREDVVQRWETTFHKRSNYRNVPIVEYMTTFLALKLALGYTLAK